MPVTTTRFSIRDADLAQQILNEIYVPDRPFAFQRSEQKFEFDVRSMQLGELHAGRFRQNMSTDADMGPFPEFMAGVLLAGRMQWASAGEEVRLAPGGVGHYPTAQGLKANWTAMDFALLRIPLSTVTRVAEDQAGVEAAHLRFSSMAPVSGDAARQWVRLTGYVYRSLCADGFPDNPLVLEQLYDTIAATALAVFPNSTMTADYVPGPGQVGPATLRRAVAHIEAHAGEPIDLADLATAAGVSGRALQAAFRRHHDCTPTAYLRKVRLERAHAALQTDDPTTGATVADIAATWGFGDPARFARVYRQRYGIPPSTTLNT